jgi:hypothetical protein
MAVGVSSDVQSQITDQTSMTVGSLDSDVTDAGFGVAVGHTHDGGVAVTTIQHDGNTLTVHTAWNVSTQGNRGRSRGFGGIITTAVTGDLVINWDGNVSSSGGGALILNSVDQTTPVPAAAEVDNQNNQTMTLDLPSTLTSEMCMCGAFQEGFFSGPTLVADVGTTFED